MINTPAKVFLQSKKLPIIMHFCINTIKNRKIFDYQTIFIMYEIGVAIYRPYITEFSQTFFHRSTNKQFIAHAQQNNAKNVFQKVIVDILSLLCSLQEINANKLPTMVTSNCPTKIRNTADSAHALRKSPK